MAETINTYEAPQPEDQAYIKQMTDKVDAASAEAEPELPQDSRPEWLPEKFQSAEDLAKAYSELESKLGNNEPAEATEEAAREAVDEVGLDFDSMSSEFWENNGLSDATYDKLAAAGIPSDVVDAFIDGQMAVADQARNEAFNMVGGEQQYVEMVEWAQNNLSENEIMAYNQAVESGDPNATKLAISGLQAQYRMDNGQEPNLISGEAVSASSGAFQSVAELTAAMADPRYSRDPAYRKQVSDKLARSSVL